MIIHQPIKMVIRVVFTFLFTLVVSTYRVYGDKIATDIVFVVDGSSATKVVPFVREKNFIASIINELDISRQGTNVGIVVYGSDVGNVVSLAPFKSKPMLNLLTGELRKMRGPGRNTAIGIKTAVDMLKRTGRTAAKKFMVVFMGGSSDTPSLTIEQANYAKQRGIAIICIGFGSNQPPEFEREMVDIANPDSMYVGNSFQDLNKFAIPIAELINPVIQEADSCKLKSLNCPALRKPKIISVENKGRCQHFRYQCLFDPSLSTVV